MSGTLILVAGPSGAGKDTLIALARERLRGDPRFVFARRIITRPPDLATEDHEPASPEAFGRALAAGEFALAWQAHGLHYGISRRIEDDLAAARTVVVNVSRAVIQAALCRFPRCAVVIVTAPTELLAARLAARGREIAVDRDERLQRPDFIAPDGLKPTYIANDRTPGEGADQLVALLRASTLPASRDRCSPGRVPLHDSDSHDGSKRVNPSIAAGADPRVGGETVLTNARLILDREVVEGSIVFARGSIRAIDQGRSQVAGAIDCEGDFVCAGLVEMHTDNLEKHLVPRPKVRWPNPLAAAIANDAQMAASGITTVFDAVCAGTYENAAGQRKEIFYEEIEAVEEADRQGLFRIGHFLHLRCELSDPELARLVEPHVGKPILKLVSLMDHTPGQRQWSDPVHLRSFMTGTGRTEQEIDAAIAARRERGLKAVSGNWPRMVALFRGGDIVLASHDDTTPAHVDEAVLAGCTISEFPTTVAAARAAKRAGLATVGGAPNIVRGGSHSGGAAMRDLIAEGVLDGLSSDYVPASLLQAVYLLTQAPGLALHQAFALVTSRIAAMVRLADRGRLAPGLRADMVRLRFVGQTPLVRRVWSGGAIVF